MKKILKNYWYIIIIIVCILSIVLITNYEDEREVILDENKSFEEVKTEEKENNIIEVNSCDTSTFYIDIKGEVKRPGVYEIDSNKRVIDVVNMAGGFTKDADTSILNLSKKLKDEMSIKIYSKKEINDIKNSLVKEPEVIEVVKEVEKIVEVEKECLCEDNDICTTSNEILGNEEHIDEISNEQKKSLVNINTATKEELMSVNGIGETKAIKIIEYREKNKFENIEDIMNVSGIGNAMFEKIKEYITV